MMYSEYVPLLLSYQFKNRVSVLETLFGTLGDNFDIWAGGQDHSYLRNVHQSHFTLSKSSVNIPMTE